MLLNVLTSDTYKMSCYCHTSYYRRKPCKAFSICIPELIRSRLGTSVHSIECLVLYKKRPSQVSRRPGLVTRHDIQGRLTNRRTWYFTENLTINIYSSLIVTIRYYSSLFATIRHYLRLFAVFGDYSGFITSQVSGIKTENPNAPSLRGGPLNRRRMRNQRERLFISCTEPGVIDAKLKGEGRGGALIRALDVIRGIRTRITAEKLKSWNYSCYLTSRVLPDFFRSVDSQYVFTGPQLNRKYSPTSLSWFGPCRFFNVKRSEHLKTAISLNTVMIPVWIVVTLSGEWQFFHANDLLCCHFTHYTCNKGI